MALQTLDSGRIVLSNAEYFHVTPYINEDTIGDVTYDIVNIVADSLSLTPDDNTVNAKEWEFGDTPLFENITLGKIQFAATCIDFQNEVLKNMFGWKQIGGALVAPNAYRDLYAVIEIGFKNEDTKVVVPKLKLNSKAIISTLKTGTGEGNLAGTAYNAKLNVGSHEEETPMAFLDNTISAYTVLNKSFAVHEGVAGAKDAVKVEISAVTKDSATLSITAPTIATKAILSDGTEVALTSGAGTQALSSLESSKTYTYGVVAYDVENEIVGANSIVFTTLMKED